jgi:outer membrane protein
MMKFAAAILALASSATVAVAEPPRVALVRVADVFRQHEETARSTELLKAKRDALNKDPRLAAYNGIHADLEARRKQLAGTASKIEPEARKKLEREYAIRNQEANALRADYETFHAERSREINAEMVESMKQRLELIRETAEKVARDEGYDWVLDSSGNTNTGVPLVLYAKSPNDLTDRVIAALAKPPATPPTPVTEPAKATTGKKR